MLFGNPSSRAPSLCPGLKNNKVETQMDINKPHQTVLIQAAQGKMENLVWGGMTLTFSWGLAVVLFLHYDWAHQATSHLHFSGGGREFGAEAFKCIWGPNWQGQMLLAFSQKGQGYQGYPGSDTFEVSKCEITGNHRGVKQSTSQAWCAVCKHHDHCAKWKTERTGNLQWLKQEYSVSRLGCQQGGVSTTKNRTAVAKFNNIIVRYNVICSQENIPYLQSLVQSP